MRRWRSPSARAASMYCISRMDSTLARMTRAARGTMGIEIAMITLGTDGPSDADITSASTSSGSPCRMSITRWATRSILPPAYAGQQADDAAEHRAEQRGAEADDQRDAGAVHDARVDVAAEVVGAEPVRRRSAWPASRRPRWRSGRGSASTSAKTAVRTMTSMRSAAGRPQRLLAHEADEGRRPRGLPADGGRRRAARPRPASPPRRAPARPSSHSAPAGRARRRAGPPPGWRR